MFLTFYYKPDLCAGSFRNTALAEKLSSLLSPGDTIDVLTTMPNRYPSYRIEAKHAEITGNLNIRRISIPGHAADFAGQARSFRKYYDTVLKSVNGKKYDIVFASSSRLFTAFLGYKTAELTGARLYLDIRDLFTETMNEVIRSRVLRNTIMPALKRIERKTFGKADHINLVSEGFLPYIQRFGVSSLSYFTNGIDEEFLGNHDDHQYHSGPKIITYAGNIGQGQGLEKIIPEAARLLGNDYIFRIIGDGGTRKLLESRVRKSGISNVELIRPVGRTELIGHYIKSDFLFIHLNDYESFEKVLPSKLFEYCAFDKPIIAGLAGYPKKFLRENVDNHILFNPGDASGLASGLKNYEYRKTRRTDFINKYRRDNIMQKMAESIVACAGMKPAEKIFREELV